MTTNLTLPTVHRKPRHSLADTQRMFASVVLRRLTPRSRIQKTLPNSCPTKTLAESIVKPNNRLTSLDRIEIYNRTYWFRLLDCFREDFPTLRALLGERKFSRLSVEYLEAHPSRSWTLRNLPQFLLRFLKTHSELIAPHIELATDIAALEWAQAIAFDGPTLPPVTHDQLVGANPAKLRLRLQPDISLIKSHYAIDDYLLAAKEAVRRHNPAPRRPTRQAQPLFIAAHRHDNSVYYKRLDPAAYTLLQRLNRGQSLAAAFENLHPMPAPAHVKHWFETWMSLGWLIPAEQTIPKKLSQTRTRNSSAF